MDFNEIWSDLEQGIKEILHKKLQEPYTKMQMLAKDICNKPIIMHRNSNLLISGASWVGKESYERLKNILENHSTELLHQLVKFEDNEVLLDNFSKQWILYKSSSKALNSIFSYLNDYYVKRAKRRKQNGIYEIYRLALDIWKEQLFKVVNERVTNAILKSIDEERNGGCIKRSVIRDSLNCYVEMIDDELKDEDKNEQKLSVYRNNFENKFLAATTAFYEHELKTLISTEYMKHVEKRLDEERKRVENSDSESALTPYLDVSTWDKLEKICKVVFIKNNSDRIYSEFQNFLNADQIENLKRIYSLVATMPNNYNKLLDILQDHILQQGYQAIEKCVKNAANDPNIYVQAISEVVEKYMTLILTAFNNDRGFVAAFDQACEKFINCNAVTKATRNSKSPELLARYFDILLKKSSKNREENELEDKFIQAMTVLKFITDKDVFEKFYTILLTRRFTNDILASDDVENKIISQLKHTYGSVYTLRMAAILKEIAQSKDLNTNFEQHLRNSEVLMEMNFKIKLLSSNCWLLNNCTSFSLPVELEKAVRHFSTFYAKSHSGHKLNWQHHMGEGELVTNCFLKRYTLKATTFQMAVLLQFNEQTRYSVKQLLENTQIQEGTLIQILQTLLEAELLTCTDNTDNEIFLTTDSIMELYLEYNNKKLRVKINQPLKTELKVEQEIVNESFDRERKVVIQATIVGIMKMRKILEHTQLISAVIHQLSSRFNPEISDIKKCIDFLIDKEYIRRSEEETNTYSYVA